MTNTPWITDLVRTLNPQLLTREEFIAKYFPKYVQPWKPDYRIHLRPDGRPVRMPTAGDAKAQTTKRNNRIDAAYTQYVSCFNSIPNQSEKLRDWEEHRKTA